MSLTTKVKVAKFSFLNENSYNKTVIDFNTRDKLLTKKLLEKGHGYYKLRKTFSKFYRRYYDLLSKFQVGLKSLLRQGLSEPDYYGDLVYKLMKIVGSNNFSAQFIKIISHYKKIGYNINVLQQSACLVINPITVVNFAFLFYSTPVGRAHLGLPVGFILLRYSFLFTVESLSLLHLFFYIFIYMV